MKWGCKEVGVGVMGYVVVVLRGGKVQTTQEAHRRSEAAKRLFTAPFSRNTTWAKREAKAYPVVPAPLLLLLLGAAGAARPGRVGGGAIARCGANKPLSGANLSEP